MFLGVAVATLYLGLAVNNLRSSRFNQPQLYSVKLIELSLKFKTIIDNSLNNTADLIRLTCYKHTAGNSHTSDHFTQDMFSFSQCYGKSDIFVSLQDICNPKDQVTVYINPFSCGYKEHTLIYPLWRGWCTYLEVAGRCEHGFDGSHAVVVVGLGGELLGTQPVRRDDLDGERPSVDEAARVQHDL